MVEKLEHIKTMLNFEGFINAKIYTYNKNTAKKYILIHYFVTSIDDLNDYIENYSYKMRKSGAKEFNDRVKIKRRVLEKI